MERDFVILAAFAVVVITIIAAGAILFAYRRSMSRQYQMLLQKLDSALTGEMVDTVYDESLDSAISERLNRIVEIAGMRRDRAEEERDVVRSMISDISHQVRTPLSNIMLYTGLLKEDLGRETEGKGEKLILAGKTLTPIAESEAARTGHAQAVTLADKIEKNAGRLEFYMKELIRSSCVEQEMIAIHPQMVEVDELIRRSCQMAELGGMKKGIRVNAEYHGYTCFADQRWTEEALGNLLDNAIKYSPEGSQVTITSVLYESFVCIRVQDTGRGIPEEEQGKIFQRFYRGTNVKEEPGVGIGLYLAREVVSRQRGYLKAVSAPDRGTAMEVYLPRCDD